MTVNSPPYQEITHTFCAEDGRLIHSKVISHSRHVLTCCKMVHQRVLKLTECFKPAEYQWDGSFKENLRERIYKQKNVEKIQKDHKKKKPEETIGVLKSIIACQNDIFL